MKQVRRLQPRHPIQARNGLLGGEKPMVCIPLVGKDHDGIVSEAKNVPSIAPDIIELRIDAWDFVEDQAASLAMIKEVRAIVGETPIILTCRGDWEGGFKKVSDEAKFGVYEAAVKEGLVDFIDVELIYGEDKIKKVLDLLDGTKTSLIVSFHDFKRPRAATSWFRFSSSRSPPALMWRSLRRCRRRRRTFSTCSPPPSRCAASSPVFPSSLCRWAPRAQSRASSADSSARTSPSRSVRSHRPRDRFPLRSFVSALT